MSNKHTPGPWAVDDKCDVYAEILPSGMPNYIAITPMPSSGLTEKARANSCLIAAAPDLLALAKDVELHAAERYGLDFLVAQARAAIKKATSDE